MGYRPKPARARTTPLDKTQACPARPGKAHYPNDVAGLLDEGTAGQFAWVTTCIYCGQTLTAREEDAFRWRAEVFVIVEEESIFDLGASPIVELQDSTAMRAE